MKNIIATLILVANTFVVFAQTDVDLLRYSSPFNLGSARSAAVGSATAGLGGDISNLNTNPAGLGQFGISEVSISAGWNTTKSIGSYIDSKTAKNKTAFQLNNFGLAFVPKKQFSAIKNLSFSASYNRDASFNYHIQARGVNHRSSYSDIFAETLNNAGVDSAGAMTNYPFDASLGFESGVIDRTSDNFFYSIMELPITQRYDINRSGNLNTYAFGAGIALNDKIMLGMNISIPTIKFEEDFYVREDDDENVTQDLNYWDKRDIVRTEGNGVRATFGALYLPTPELRIGLSVTTPTRYSMKDVYRTYFRADYEDFTIDNYNDPADGYFDYKIKTPMRLNAGASYVRKGLGFASVEYEFSNPSKAKYIFEDNYQFDMSDYQNQMNSNMSNKYKATHTVKVGLEGVISEHFRVRAGFQYRTSPFAEQSSLDRFAKNTNMAISGGLGYVGKSFFADATYVHLKSDEMMIPYTNSFASADVLSSKYSRSNILFTIGFKF
ncbi:MAG: hypothetical protein M9887_02135 [Chitinophagales bacterium]|nr:hypothetical protein [Chitinophagales bacterium]